MTSPKSNLFEKKSHRTTEKRGTAPKSVSKGNEDSIIFENSRSSRKLRQDMTEIAFEMSCQDMLKNHQWEKLELAAIAGSWSLS